MRNFFKSRLPQPPRSELHISFHGSNSPSPIARFLTLETKIIILVWIVVAVSLVTTYFLIVSKVNDIVEELMGKNATRIAAVVAKSPAVVASLSGNQQSIATENWAALLGEVTQADFIVYDIQGNIRYRSSQSPLEPEDANPYEDRQIEPQDYVYLQQVSRGYFLRATSPIFAADSRQIGTVAVGISTESALSALGASRFIMVFSNYFGLVLGMIGALFLARNIKETLFGLEPFAIARLLEERNAMLQSVREGIVAIDATGRITLINDEALRLLDMEGKRDNLLDRPIDSVIPRTRLLDILATKQAEYNQEELLNGIAVVMNRVPVNVEDRTVAAIATFRDRSEVKKMAEELTGVRTYVEALRAQTHEFMNKLHVILGLVRLKALDELVAYVTRISSEQDAATDFVTQRIKDPVLAGFWLGKRSRARELGVQLGLNADSFVPHLDNVDFTNDLVTVIGNLVDNAMEALLENSRRYVEVLMLYNAGSLKIEVKDTGPGIPPELAQAIFEKGFSTKAPDRGFGLALVKKVLERRQGTLSFESSLQLGTTFRLLIPYEEVNYKYDKNPDR
jgi:CitB family two-component system sensor histidine kinase MalK